MKSTSAPDSAPANETEARAETAPEQNSAWLEVRGVTVEPTATGRRVVIVLTRPADGIHETGMAQPPRIVIDMAGPRPSTPMLPTPYPLSDEVVPQVRVGSYGPKLRAVIDLAHAPGTHAVRQEGATIVAEIGDADAPATNPPPASPPAAARAVPAETAEAPETTGEAAAWLTVRDVQVEHAGAGRRLIVTLSRAPESVRDFVLPTPPRLVIDLRGPLPGTPVATRFPVTDDVVSRVRVATYEGSLRVVADLNQPAGAHAVHQDGARLIADLGETSAQTEKSDFEDGGIVLASALVTEPETTTAATDAKPAEPVQLAMAGGGAKERPAPAPRPTKTAAKPDPVALAALAPAPAPNPAVFTGQKISLDFKDADIHNVLRVLADVSGLNIIATDDVKGKITLHLNDVPWDQALDLVLRANRLEKSQEGNVVRISTVSRLKEEREALRAAQDAERELEPLRVKYIRVNYARADEALIEKVKGVLTDRGSVTFDDRTNTIIVRDIPRGIEDATQLVHELDIQSPQVLIESNIVEATEDFARALGIQWGYVYNGGPQTGTPTGMNFPGTVGIGGNGLGVGAPPPSAGGGVTPTPVPFLADFPVPAGFGSGFGAGTGSALNLALGSLNGANTLTARLTALEEAGKGKVISRPRVITMNNVAATIQSLTILRVKLPSTGTVINTGTGGAAGAASTATEKINTGITLVVTPQISQDGFVLMNIYAKSSLPDFTRSVDGIPSEISREANSNVLVRDGETVVLGGIFRSTADDRESGIPYLRKVPALGWLFKRVLETHHREELLVFLTPKVISTGNSTLPVAERLWEERRHGG